MRFSFADPIRDMLMVLGVTKEQLSDPVLKEQPCDALLGNTPRWGMQSLGTNWAREMIHPDIWVRLAALRLEKAKAEGKAVVLDDCRFDNEAEVWRAAGGTVIEITRSGLDYNRDHPSEAGLSRHLISCSVSNDSTTERLIGDIEYILNLNQPCSNY